MKLSKFIAELEKVKEKFGDLPLIIESGGFKSPKKISAGRQKMSTKSSVLPGKIIIEIIIKE